MVKMSTLLGDDDLALWHLFKQANQAVMGGLERELSEKAHMSGHDFGILSRLDDNGEMRQHVLAESMNWHKSRLSHHLSRMEERELVRRRTENPKNVTIAITAWGRKLLAAARPAHAQAIRTHLLAKLGKNRKAFIEACTALAKNVE